MNKEAFLQDCKTVGDSVRGTCQSLERLLAEMVDLGELRAPEYSREGVESLYVFYSDALAHSQRASGIMAHARMLVANARDMLFPLQSAYSNTYDNIYAQQPADRGLSWEQQTARVRFRMLDETIALNNIKNALTKADNLLGSLDTLAQAKYRLRWEAKPILDVLRFGESLHELD